MDKTAQRRSNLNKLREFINMPGKILDGTFRKEIENVMISLKTMDDKIRSTFTGKAIGSAAPTDPVAIKDILKNARRNFNRREYMSAVIDLGHFHKKMLEVSKDISSFKLETDQIHHKFVFDGLKGTDYESKLDPFRQHMQNLQTKADYSNNYFIKEAGMLDDLLTFLSRRGRGLMAWEKRYPQRIKALRDGADALINEAQKMFEGNITSLKAMATARATRRPDEYMEYADKIKNEFTKFDAKFRSYYAEAVQPWLKIKDDTEAAEKAKAEAAKSEAEKAGNGTPVTDPRVVPSTSTPASSQNIKQDPSSNVNWQSGLPISSPPFAPAAIQQLPEPEVIDDGPPTERVPVVKTHQKFYESLKSLSKESPQILAKYISKYATSIQLTDPETAIKLFKISQKTKE